MSGLNFAERVPPQNLEAEQSVLGAMLLDSQVIATIQSLLSPHDFYLVKHQHLFEVMSELHDRGEPVDTTTLSAELTSRDLMDSVGGLSYLAELMNVVPTTANAEAYALIVEQKAVLRRLQTAARKIQEDAYQGDTLDDVLNEAERAIFEVTQRRTSKGYEHIHGALMTAFEQIEFLYAHKGQTTGVTTGFNAVDRMTNGLQPSDLVILAARPSLGKTAFSLNIARNAAVLGGTCVGLFSLEMGREQLAMRLLSSEAAVDQHRLRNGELSDEDWGRLTTGLARLADAPIYIDDTPNIPLMELRSRARRLKSEHNVGLIIIDYLQLMSVPSRGGQANRQQEISEISRSLKALARELKCPVIALSQLSRAVESRQDKRPMLSDLRESGAIEQDADMVCFLYREDYYDHETENKNVCELIIGKHRNGPVGTVELAFIKEIGKFFDRPASA